MTFESWIWPALLDCMGSQGEGRGGLEDLQKLGCPQKTLPEFFRGLNWDMGLGDAHPGALCFPSLGKEAARL